MRNIFYSLCFFVICVLLLEVGAFYLLRTINEEDQAIGDDLSMLLENPQIVPDADMLFKLKPRLSARWGDDITYMTNEDGFRGAESFSDFDHERQISIIALGDSCTFGLGVEYEETYTVLLERLLRAEGMDVRVFNCGVPGYTSFQCLRSLLKIVERISPDIIMCYIGANDGGMSLGLSDIGHHAVMQRSMNWYYDILMGSNVYRYIMALKKNDQRKKRNSALQNMGLDSSDVQYNLNDLFGEMSNEYKQKLKEYFPNVRVTTNESRDNIKGLNEIAKAHNARFIYMPTVYNMNNEMHYNAALLDCPYLDIKKALEQYTTEEIFIDPVHFTQKGHEIMAKTIFSELYVQSKNND